MRRAPHRIAAYALELAQHFTAFYRDCKVIGAEPESVESFRVALSQAARQVIALVAVAARGQRAGLDVGRLSPGWRGRRRAAAGRRR